MPAHLRQHSFTGNTDHDFTGLSNNYLPKLNSVGTGITNSLIYDNGTDVGVGTASPTAKLSISGNGNTSSTSSLKISDSVGKNLLEIQDNSWFTFGWNDTIGTPRYMFKLYPQGSSDFVISGLSQSNGIRLYDSSGGNNIYSIIGTPFAGTRIETNNYLDSAISNGTSGIYTRLVDGAFGQGPGFGINIQNPLGTLHVGGRTANNTTFNSYFTNSASTVLMTIRNDGYTRVGGTSSGVGIFEASSANTHGIVSIVDGTDNIYAGLGITNGSTWFFRANKSGEIQVNSAQNSYFIGGGNVGVGYNLTSPTEKIHISGGTIRIQTVNGTEGAGKLAVSDVNGSISFSSTTALGIITSAGTVNKYATTITTPGANATNTITHNIGTTDITVALWLETTGDMTSARITNRQTNSVDIIFASAPGENVRVVITG